MADEKDPKNAEEPIEADEASHAEHTAADGAEHAEEQAHAAVGAGGSEAVHEGEGGARRGGGDDEEGKPGLEAAEGVPEKVAEAEAREAEADALTAAMVEASADREAVKAPVVDAPLEEPRPAVVAPAVAVSAEGATDEPGADVPGREEAERLIAQEDVAGHEENPIVGPAVVATTDDKAPGEHPAGPKHEPRPHDIDPAGQAEVRDGVLGVAAFFDHPHDLMNAAAAVHGAEFQDFDAYSPFPIHGMDDAMGLSRSWLPWVTFGAGSLGFLTANALQFGMLTFDWPMIIGGKPFAPWPSFVPIMFELTVLIGGVTTALVMLIASGCFRKPFVIDREITNDRFVLWIAASDPLFHDEKTRAFLQGLEPVEVRTITKGA